MKRFHNVRGRVIGLAFAPDGKTLTACCQGQQTLAMWDLAGDTFRRWHPYCDGAVQSFAYSPDGKWLLVGGREGIGLPYELPAWDYDSEFIGGEAVACAPVGKNGSQRMVTGSNVVRLWDMVHSEQEWGIEFEVQDRGFVRAVAFSPNGKLLANSTFHGFVRVWDPDRRELRFETSYGSHVPAVGFTADGKTLAAASGRDIYLYSVNKWKQLEPLRGHTLAVTGMAMHTTAVQLLTASSDGTARLWAVPGGELKCWDWKTGPLSAAAISADGLMAAVGSAKGEVVLWDLDG